MRGYRCYLLASNNHIREAQEFMSESDDQAVALARQYAAARNYYSNVEVWSGPRLVWSERLTNRD